MQVLCKSLITFTFFLLLSSFVTAQLDECTGTISQDDIPCHIFLAVNDTSTCTNINVSFYNETKNLYNISMDTYNNVVCNATFNQTVVGTYVFEYTSGDSGSIIVKEGLKLINLLWYVLVILSALIIFGITKENVPSISIGAMGLIILGIYFWRNGFGDVNNLLTNFLAMCVMALGFYFMIPLFQWAVDEINLTS